MAILVFGLVCLSVVVSAIPRLKESHEIPRLQFDSPNIIRVLGFTKDQSNLTPIVLHGKRRNLDSLKIATRFGGLPCIKFLSRTS